MRINKFVALATGLSRRAADTAIKAGRVRINHDIANLGHKTGVGDEVFLDDKKLSASNANFTTIMINKPAGYVCSRRGQGSKTIYELLPEEYHKLKPIGRLDKDSSGLILLTDDGKLANELTHPKYQKNKIYQVELNKSLSPDDKKQLVSGVKLSDGTSKFIKLKDYSNNTYEVTLHEGRNRQIRRTFNALGYKVISLHRTSVGDYRLTNLVGGKFRLLK